MKLTVRSRLACSARLLSALVVVALPCARAHAAEPASAFAAPALQATPGAAGGLLRVMLALIVVLAAVLVVAWLGRRMRAFGGARGAEQLQLLAQLPLGARERAVLLRVGDSRLLLGVSPGSVRTLHVLPAAAAADAAPLASGDDAPAVAATDAPPSFKSLLLRSLGR